VSTRKIGGKAATMAKKLRAKGDGPEAIARELAAIGVVVTERTVRRYFASLGAAETRRQASRRTPSRPRGAKRASAPTPPSAEAFDERAWLVHSHATLIVELEGDIPPADKARISAECRTLGQRIAALDAASSKPAGIAEEDLRQRGAHVRAQLLKTKAAKDGLRLVVDAGDEADNSEPEEDVDDGEAEEPNAEAEAV
jgi:hypothetical protein